VALSPPAGPAEAPGLAQHLHLALQRHPKVEAARAGLAAAQDLHRSLTSLRVPALLAPDLDVRRQQAALGTSVAAAALDQAEREAVYAVTRTYFTVLYARAQERVASGVVARLSATRDVAQGMLKEGARDVSSADVNRTLVYLRLAQMKQVEAEQGVKRALVAHREAVGLGPECKIDVAPGELPGPRNAPSREAVVAGALARRGELAQVNLLAQITALEVEAQSRSHRLRLQTFAAGSDVHSQQVPQEARDKEYRPGAVPPAMPTVLAGCRPERMKHAQSLTARSNAVAQATRNLIALEAEDAFLRWEEASRQVEKAREAATSGDKLADDLSKDFTSGLKVRVEDVVSARVLAAQARAQLNESLYRQVLALADLERTTGGAFAAGLVELAATLAQPEGERAAPPKAPEPKAPEPQAAWRSAGPRLQPVPK
jgi:outer membrane protein TolC